MRKNIQFHTSATYLKVKECTFHWLLFFILLLQQGSGYIEHKFYHIFHLLYIYIYICIAIRNPIHYREGYAWIQMACLDITALFCTSQAEDWISNNICMVFFCVLWFEVWGGYVVHCIGVCSLYWCWWNCWPS